MANNQTFVNLLWDAGFKAVYADRANKPLLISLLNLVLPEGVHVHDIVKYRDREQERDTVYSKKTTLDLVCEDDKGNIFSVEVQRETGDVFFQRMRLLCSRALPRRADGKGVLRQAAPGLSNRVS